MSGESANPASMQIVDLRQLHSRSLDALFQEEVRHWREELYWDYRPSIDLIRKFIDSRALGGYAALEDGHAAGYGFYVLEDHKGLIGGLFVSPHFPQTPITQRLLTEMLGALRATPRLERVEAQLMPFGTELDPSFLSQYFRLHARQFMVLPIANAKLLAKPLSTGLRIEPWTDRAFESAARLIQLAYADHVDSQINDQYCSEAGGLRFLRNIVLLPGCGQFLPEASFLVRPATADHLIAMVLTSTVAEGVGHTTQICVMPGHQGHSIGRQLMENSILALKRRHYESLSLTVTSINRRAVELYEHLGFRTVKTFAAGVWQA
ncbi:MAG TPA: GNAT family N-acetyltransferase [Verrucomicrobiae bacterium]|jgi:ribosomal protein S18 acetylase RimI-like enzyme|nr:GNAT family N-acetyltransferase [Verrucomicrobiae bacterium]